MLKRLFLITMALAVAVSCSDANKAFVRKAVRIMDKNGLFAEGPGWEAAKAQALQAKPASMAQAHDQVLATLKVAGGKHSFIQSAQSVTQNATSEWPAPSISFQDDGIPVIALPHFSGNSDEGVKYADAVLNALPDALPGAVIDLRGNTGGNMYPMIAAVQRFLPDGDVIRFRTRKRTQWLTLEYVVNTTGVQRLSRIDCPVAILTDDHTGSSGEAVLTTGCDVARTGEAFCDDPIAPDILTDDPLPAALAWLRGES